MLQGLCGYAPAITNILDIRFKIEYSIIREEAPKTEYLFFRRLLFQCGQDEKMIFIDKLKSLFFYANHPVERNKLLRYQKEGGEMDF